MNKLFHSAIALILLFCMGCGSKKSDTGETKQLNLYIWSAYVTPKTLEQFHQETGITVRYDTYDSNEALLEKVQDGASEYDVVVPTNDIVTTMVRLNLLQKLDLVLLPNLKNLGTRFRNPSFDPNNEHSIPFIWGTTGIGYNKTKITEPVDSWAILWDPKYKGRILMLDDPWECIGAALKLKGHRLNSDNPDELLEAKNLLLQQKPLIKMYNSANFDEILLSGDIWLAQAWSGQLARAIDQNPDLAYAIPKEGSAVWTDCLAIPKNAPHVAEAHAFLNFCMDKKVAAEITKITGYATTNEAAKAYIDAKMLQDKARYPDETTLARCEWFIARGKTSQILDRYWTEVKSK
ncbi:MAG TPA: spermidine/putrescine ABC transporter substrate-binding protein [Acidobacteriota bacterium]